LGIIILFLSIYIIYFKNIRKKFEEPKSETKETNLIKDDNFIPVVVCFDDNYFYPAMVSMTSMLESSNKKINYKIFALISGDIIENDRKKFKTLEEKYSNAKVELIDMGNQFEEYSNKMDFCEGGFYILKIPDLLPKEIHKCIYLDSDTLVIKDLKELYDYDIDDNYISGIPDLIRTGFDWGKPEKFIFGIPKLDQYINSGVMLWNLDECRKDELTKKFMLFLKNNWNGHFHDQCVINKICYGKIKDLPFKFNVCKNSFQNDFKFEHKTGESDIDEPVRKEVIEDPVILHLCFCKPWRAFGPCAEDWWKTARKTPFYNEIFNKYSKNFNDKDKEKILNFFN
jgi:lipopolysaccharide biosynthesis glycosyltransferase